jgi:uncharacterized protein YgbK (DUF1537 family)
VLSGDGPVLIASSSTPQEAAALRSRHGGNAAGHAIIGRAMADLADGLVRSGVRGLIVADGETSGAVVDRPGFPDSSLVLKSLRACRFCARSVRNAARRCLLRNQAISAGRSFSLTRSS